MPQDWTKAPTEILDYTIDWEDDEGIGPWLVSGDTITGSTWAVTPSGGLTIGSQSYTTTTTTVWLSSGTVDIDYIVKNTVTTANGRTGVRSIKIRVRNR